jgi:uncharacterized protein (TIGR03790 family)
MTGMIRLLRWLPYFAAALVLASGADARAQNGSRISVDHVLVVSNDASPDSVAIANYFAEKHRLPAGNLMHIRCADMEECTGREFDEQIQSPIKAYLAKKHADIDYLLLTKGIPIRVGDGARAGYSVDSLLTMLDRAPLATRTPNPYFAKVDRFSHREYNMYLVTRLIGYTRADCLALVDHALKARSGDGVFLFHVGPGHEGGGYKSVNEGMRKAHGLLSARGLRSVLSTSETFAGGYIRLMGYFSWGSNDGKYDKKAYNSLRFLPGAVAETAVSTSGRTFTDPNAPGQSLIADLVAQGVTGCKGYVSEPYADAIAHADILFDRYAQGYNLAESFYMASYWVYWKGIVIGDPLCAPFAAAK